MLVYPSSIDLSSRTLRHLTRQRAAHRREIGTRWRRLPVGRQALLALAHLRCGDTYAQLAAGFEIGIATVYRYIREAVEVLAAQAQTLAEAMTTVRTKAYVILDSTLLPIDRIAADTPYYSGKHKRHGMNVQVITDPFSRLLWASAALPGSTHDLTAAREHGIIDALATAGLKCWADKAYQEAYRHVRVPFRGRRLQALEATAQQHPRQNPVPRRAGHGRPEGLAPATQAPLQHQPDHRHREGRRRPSPRLNLRLERAHSCAGTAGPSAVTGQDPNRAHD